ncbi:MAG: hypothetical protein AAFP19_15735 [Bacteroidota bacterium]
MKRLNALLILSLLFLSTAFAQQSFIGGWQLGKIGISFGGDQDMIRDLNHSYLLSTIDGPTVHDYSNLNFEEGDLSSMVCDNTHTRLTMAFTPPSVRNTEIRMSIVHIGDRVDAVSFNGYDDEGAQRNLHFNLYSSEIAFEAVALKRASVGRRLHFYGGMGTNTGYSYDNELEVYGDNLTMMPDGNLQFRVAGDTPMNDVGNIDSYAQSYQASNAIHQRLFLQAGIGVSLFKALELNFDIRKGIGYRMHKGADCQATRMNSSSLGLYWYVFR